MKKLDRLRSKELRTWWDYTTLSSYVDKSMIVRGLRIKKPATIVYSDLFQEQWNATLTNCSMDLMKLIMKFEQDALKSLESEIQQLKEAASKYVSST